MASRVWIHCYCQQCISIYPGFVHCHITPQAPVRYEDNENSLSHSQEWGDLGSLTPSLSPWCFNSTSRPRHLLPLNLTCFCCGCLCVSDFRTVCVWYPIKGLIPGRGVVSSSASSTSALWHLLTWLTSCIMSQATKMDSGGCSSVSGHQSVINLRGNDGGRGGKEGKREVTIIF